MPIPVETLRIQTPSGGVLIGDAAGPRDAPAVILMHGGGQTRHSWAGELERLAGQGYRAISYDARGHGESDWAKDGDYGSSALAEDLGAVLAGVSRPIALVGASMGGMTSLYAIGHSAEPLADALILVDIVPRPAAAGSAKILAFMTGNPEGFATLDEAVEAVAAYNPTRKRPPTAEGLLRNLRQRDDGRYYWHWDPRLVAGKRAEPAPLEEIAAISARIRVPTLLVRGGRSDVVDDLGVAEMQQLIPQSEVFLVPDAGHMVAGDDNSTFHEGIIGFLRQHLPITG